MKYPDVTVPIALFCATCEIRHEVCTTLDPDGRVPVFKTMKKLTEHGPGVVVWKGGGAHWYCSPACAAKENP